MNAHKILIGIGIIASSFWGNTQSTWYDVTVPTQEKLNDIEFVDDQIGFIVGDNGTFLKTSNGGALWSQPAIQGIPNQGTSNIAQIEMLDAMNGFMAVEYGSSVFQTSDGGLTWNAVVNSGTNQCLPVTVHALAIDNFFVGGSDCFQGATINQIQSSNWTVKTVNYLTGNTDHYVKEMDFDGSLGLAALNAEYILRSTDTGATWDTINTNIGAGSVLTSVMIASNDTCYAGYNQNGSGFGVLFSADDGLTWQEDINSATFYYPAFYGFTEDNSGTIFCAAVSGGNIGLVFEDNATSWWFHQLDQPVYAMDSYGNDVTWAVGDSGYVVVNNDLGSLSIQENQDTENALQIFPNPTKELLGWNCDYCATLSFQILDLNGKVVQENANYTKNEIDISQLTSGVYVLSVKSTLGIHKERFIKE